MRHSYVCPSGLISVLMSAICLFVFVVNRDNYVYTTNVLLLIGAALFTIIQPINLLWKSYKTIALIPTFRAPLDYMLDEEGIHVSQNNETADLHWGMVIKVIETKTQLVIYNSPKNGFIITTKQVGENYDTIKEMLKEKVSEYCLIKMK